MAGMLVPLHRATPCNWTPDIHVLWPLELKLFFGDRKLRSFVAYTSQNFRTTPYWTKPLLLEAATGGRVAEWSERWGYKSEDLSSCPALTASWICSSSPKFESLAMLVCN